MAEIDKRSMMEAIRSKARDRMQQTILDDPVESKEQLETDMQVQSDIDMLTGNAPPMRATAPLRRMDDMARIFSNAATGGGADVLAGSPMDFKSNPIASTIKTAISPLAAGYEAFVGDEDRTEEERARTEKAKEEGGIAGTAAGIAGTVAPFLGGPAARTVRGAMGIGGVENVLMDTAEKAFSEERAPDPMESVMAGGIGAVGGGLGQFLGNRIAKMFVEKGGARTPLSAGTEAAIKRLKGEANAAAKIMDDSGVVVHNSALKQLERDLLTSGGLRRAGLGPQTSPDAWRALNVLRAQVSRGGNMTLRDLNEIRETMRKVGSSAKEDKGFLTNRIDNHISHFMANLDASQATGNVAEGVRGWKEMSKIHFKKKQSEWLAMRLRRAELFARASKTGLTVDKALQDEFVKVFASNVGERQILSLKFTPEQRSLFRDIASGGFSTNAANKMEGLFKDSIIGQVYRLTLSPAFRGAGEDTALKTAERLFSDVSGTPIQNLIPSPVRMGGNVGAGAAAAGLTPANLIPLGGQPLPPDQVPIMPPAQMVTPKVMPRPLPDQSRQVMPRDPLKEIGR